ncbi:MAG: arginine--tRNA ligase [Alphaproteobacteria bacterium]|nr:arginine--tRNA ligase [Alphaproteobacteria bacterium]NCQ88730.1 arginine--tRNA ligase [Alphaproteobacteria bacterium]NCT08172.1 arginine--tRNA ligase [Alphaproteobacteria bacterium]
MTSLTQKLSALVGAAFEGQGLAKELGLVRVSDRPDLAQYQCNGAMAAAKQAKKNPREVAQNILDALEGNAAFSKLEIAGPGFINLNITDDFLKSHIEGSQNFGVTAISPSEKVVLDYGGPNIAKAMHVGHLRAAIIGDSVRRIMLFAGYDVLGDVHMGDWGTHMGMLIADYLRLDEAHLVLETDINDAASVHALMEDMAARYPKASGEAKENASLKAEALEATVKLQNREQPYYGIWEKIRDVSVAGMKETYARLGVHFDLWKGEADVHDYIAPMVEEMKTKGIAEESDGALVVHVVDEDDNKKIPPMILYKRDGAVMYGTTDCATIVERVKLYNPSKMVYVVDQRQALHFEQVFRAVRKADIVNDHTELTHAGFGTMNGKDGKPFKTREGGVMRLEDLIQMATDKAYARLDEANLAADMDAHERSDVAHKVAIAAIKFADLQNQRQADYVFDLDRLTSFEGKTGPYLLYQAVRIKSLLNKARDAGITLEGELIVEEGNRELLLLMTQFPEALQLSINGYAPHHLCEYVFKMAQAFSSFYGNCHILSEADEALKVSRLKLCEMTVAQLEKILELLGIYAPTRM